MNKQAIYVHVPWCRRRCPYCDFYIVVGKPEDAFIGALIAEFEERRAAWLKAPADSLYFGGGTPSMLGATELIKLIHYLFSEGALKRGAEISLEANPEDMTASYADDLAQSPVSRLSLGIQSFDDKILRSLGRMHTSIEAWSAIENLKAVGRSNISVDLIIGVPGEDQELVLESIRKLAEFGIPHISCYLLTIEEKTQFYRRIKEGSMQEASEDDQVSIYRSVQEELGSLGFVQYDISSYGHPGYFSRHNQIYWSGGSYLGLGPGAHSMRFLEGGIERAHCTRPLKDWLLMPTSPDNFVYDRLGPQEALRESLSFGLRNMHVGIDPRELMRFYGCEEPKGLEGIITKMHNFGWLHNENGCLRISEEGALFADKIMREILSC